MLQKKNPTFFFQYKSDSRFKSIYFHPTQNQLTKKWHDKETVHNNFKLYFLVIFPFTVKVQKMSTKNKNRWQALLTIVNCEFNFSVSLSHTSHYVTDFWHLKTFTAVFTQNNLAPQQIFPPLVLIKRKWFSNVYIYTVGVFLDVFWWWRSGCSAAVLFIA